MKIFVFLSGKQLPLQLVPYEPTIKPTFPDKFESDKYIGFEAVVPPFYGDGYYRNPFEEAVNNPRLTERLREDARRRLQEPAEQEPDKVGILYGYKNTNVFDLIKSYTFTEDEDETTLRDVYKRNLKLTREFANINKSKRMLYFSQLDVSTPYTHLGVAAKMMDEFIKNAGDHDYIWLATQKSYGTHGGFHFWKAQGFRVGGTFADPQNIIMYKEIRK